MARRTKSQRRKERKSGYKSIPKTRDNLLDSWENLPCCKGMSPTRAVFRRLLHRPFCKYISSPLMMLYMADCPLYDKRYCPPTEEDDEV